MKKKDLIEYLESLHTKMTRCSCHGFSFIDIDRIAQKIIDLKQGEEVE